MASNTFIAFFVGVGVAIFVYRKTSYRGAGDFKKQAAPAVFAGIISFLITLTVLWTLFG